MILCSKYIFHTFFFAIFAMENIAKYCQNMDKSKNVQILKEKIIVTKIGLFFLLSYDNFFLSSQFTTFT